jgi:hypothetical protein
MKAHSYKYRLHYLLNRLPHEDYQAAMKFIPARLAISPKTFKSWIYIKSGDEKEIPSTSFYILSMFFEVEPTDLFENPPIKMSVKEAFDKFKNDPLNFMSKKEIERNIQLQLFHQEN